jgi:hypothetical protein
VDRPLAVDDAYWQVTLVQMGGTGWLSPAPSAVNSVPVATAATSGGRSTCPGAASQCAC